MLQLKQLKDRKPQNQKKESKKISISDFLGCENFTEKDLAVKISQVIQTETHSKGTICRTIYDMLSLGGMSRRMHAQLIANSLSHSRSSYDGIILSDLLLSPHFIL